MKNDGLTEKSVTLQNIKKLFSYIKMCSEILTSGNLKLRKINFTAIRFLFFLEDADIEKVLVSNKISFGEKNC